LSRIQILFSIHSKHNNKDMLNHSFPNQPNQLNLINSHSSSQTSRNLS